jgi:hypothetical protein
MKTPAHRFTIHVIKAKYIVTHLAVPRPSIWVRAGPYVAQGLTRTRLGLVQSGRVARFVVTELFHLIVHVGIGAVNGLRLVHDVSIRWLAFVFLTLPLFVIGLCFLLATLACAWGLIEALSRGLSSSSSVTDPYAFP